MQIYVVFYVLCIGINLFKIWSFHWEFCIFIICASLNKSPPRTFLLYSIQNCVWINEWIILPRTRNLNLSLKSKIGCKLMTFSCQSNVAFIACVWLIVIRPVTHHFQIIKVTVWLKQALCIYDFCSSTTVLMIMQLIYC